MKNHSHWLLNTVRIILTIVWYLNIVLIVIAFGVLTLKSFTNEYTEFSAEVKLTTGKTVVNLIPLTSYAKDISLTHDQGTIKMLFKNTALNVATAYFFLITLEVLATTIIYQLRKFFDTIKHGEPFEYQNIKRLKIIALCFALLSPLHILLGIAKAVILTTQVKNFELRNFIWEIGFNGLMLGAVIYIMADVFKYGFNLKQENEEFV